MNERNTPWRRLGRLLVLFSAVAWSSWTYCQDTCRVYFGLLHAHTSYSDGLGTPEEAFKHARDKARLHFFAVTEHNHAKAEAGIGNKRPEDKERKDGVSIANQPELYSGPVTKSLIKAAERLTTDGKFVALYGQEFSTISSGNHVNVFEVNTVIDVDNGEYAQLYEEWLTEHKDSLGEPALVQFNHPDYRADLENEHTKPSERFNDYGFDDYGRDFDKLVLHSSPYVRLIEIISGPALDIGTFNTISSRIRHEKDYWFYLSKGFKVAPTAGQDNHYRTWGTITRARTGVWAEALNRKGILSALKQRRVFASEDENLEVKLQANDHWMGEVISAAGPMNLKFSIELRDPDEAGAEYKVLLYGGSIGGEMVTDPLEEKDLTGDGKVEFDGYRYESGQVFYFVKVVQTTGHGEDLAWSAPVWIVPSDGLPGAAPAKARYVYSRLSKVYHYPECEDARRIKLENRVETEAKPEGRRLHQGCPR